MLPVTLGSNPALKTVGFPSGSTPVIPLKPSMWSKDRFSRTRTNTCSMFGLELVPARSRRTDFARDKSIQRKTSHAAHTSVIAHPNTTQTTLTTHAKALQTHFAAQ